MAATFPVGADFTRVYTAAEFELGTCGKDGAGGEFVFCSFAGTTTAKDVVGIDEAYAAAGATNTTAAALLGQKCGVCQATQTAASWGWVRRKGPETGVNVASSAAANVQIATTTTAGRVDDAVGAGTVDIEGLVLTSAESSNTANADLDDSRFAIAAN